MCRVLMRPFVSCVFLHRDEDGWCVAARASPSCPSPWRFLGVRQEEGGRKQRRRQGGRQRKYRRQTVVGPIRRVPCPPTLRLAHCARSSDRQAESQGPRREREHMRQTAAPLLIGRASVCLFASLALVRQHELTVCECRQWRTLQPLARTAGTCSHCRGVGCVGRCADLPALAPATVAATAAACACGPVLLRRARRAAIRGRRRTSGPRGVGHASLRV